MSDFSAQNRAAGFWKDLALHIAAPTTNETVDEDRPFAKGDEGTKPDRTQLLNHLSEDPQAITASEELQGLDALRAQRVVVKLRKQIFGKQHASTIDALDKLMMLLNELGIREEMAVVMEEVREARRGELSHYGSIRDEYGDSEDDDSDTELAVSRDQHCGSETKTGLLSEYIDAHTYMKNQDREQGLRALGVHNPLMSTDGYILKRTRKGMTTSREIRGSHSSGFGQAGTSSDGVRHEGFSSTAKEIPEVSINLEEPLWRESALAKASRMAWERTESGHPPLNIRREGFGMLVPFKGVAKSREVPVYERPGVRRGTDREEYEAWKIKEEAEETEMWKKAAKLKARSRYASSFGQRRAARNARSRACLAQIDGAADVPETEDITPREVRQDKGKGKVAEKGVEMLEPTANITLKRSFDEVWTELCAENGWDENDEAKKKMYEQLVGKMSERYRELCTPQPEEDSRVTVTGGTTQSREGDEEWIGQNIRRKSAPRVVYSYGSTESREVIDERVGGFGMSRQSEFGQPAIDTSKRRSAREVDTPLEHQLDNTLRRIPAERQHFHTSDNEPISSETLATYEVRRRIEEELRESRVEEKKGGATSREDALRRKYEEEHARLARLERERFEEKLRESRFEEKKGGATSREDALRRKYEEEHARLARLERERFEEEQELREADSLVKKGSAPSREDAPRRKYEENRTRLERLRREEHRAKMKQEANQEKELRLRRINEELERRQIIVGSRRKGSTESREPALRRGYEDEDTRLHRIEQEELLKRMMEEGRKQGTDKYMSKGSTDSREDEPRRKYESEKARLERLDREQPFYTREVGRKRLEMREIGFGRAGMSESRELPRYDANKERGSAASREAALRREYEEERARQHRLQRQEFTSQIKQSKQPQHTYSIGKEYLVDSNDGFRSRSTIGTTSAEKMPMRGSNDAALMNYDDGVNEDDDNVEPNLEGLVLRTRIPVPEAMRRAMEKDEEWRGFA